MAEQKPIKLEAGRQKEWIAGDVLGIAHGGTGAVDAPTALAALGGVAKAGDTMTGGLALQPVAGEPVRLRLLNAAGTVEYYLRQVPTNDGIEFIRQAIGTVLFRVSDNGTMIAAGNSVPKLIEKNVTVVDGATATVTMTGSVGWVVAITNNPRNYAMQAYFDGADNFGQVFLGAQATLNNGGTSAATAGKLNYYKVGSDLKLDNKSGFTLVARVIWGRESG